MDVAFVQFPLHTTTPILVLEMVPSSTLMLTVVAGKQVLVSVLKNPFHSFPVYEVRLPEFFVDMVRKCPIVSLNVALNIHFHSRRL